jgi:F0F1-type ATP synthase assembly protein I
MVRKEVASGTLRGKNAPDKSKRNGVILIVAALDMSWRLAIVVLVPIVGGFELDKHLGVGPALTIVGFLVAMAGVYIIMKRTVANIDERFKPKENRQ